MKKKTISISKANLFSLLFIIIIAVPTVLIYYFLWGNLKLKNFQVDYISVFVFIVIIFGSILIHELIHALLFAYFSEDKWKSVKIGVLWKQLTPYAHCNTPLLVRHYKLAVIMPGIILGILPIVLAISIESALLLYYGLFMIMAAAGDFMIFILLLKISKSKKILDHESEMGFYII